MGVCTESQDSCGLLQLLLPTMAPASLAAVSWSPGGRGTRDQEAQPKDGCPGIESKVLRPWVASGLRLGCKAFKGNGSIERS